MGFGRNPLRWSQQRGPGDAAVCGVFVSGFHAEAMAVVHS